MSGLSTSHAVQGSGAPNLTTSAGAGAALAVGAQSATTETWATPADASVSVRDRVITPTPITVLDWSFHEAPWTDDEAWTLEALLHGTVLKLEPIGHGITKPLKASIEYQDRRIQAVWKPIRRHHYTEHESWQAEVAAYRLSRYLGLDMVPPTVARKIGRKSGSLQLWVEDHDVAAQVYAEQRGNYASADQLEAMRLFDLLIDNPDRHGGNYLLGRAGRIVLIDHSRAFDHDSRFRNHQGRFPTRLPSTVLQKLGQLNLETLEELLGDVMQRSDRQAILRSVGRVMDRVEFATVQTF